MFGSRSAPTVKQCGRWFSPVNRAYKSAARATIIVRRIPAALSRGSKRFYQEDGPIGWLTLNRPDDGNMFTPQMCHEIRDCINAVRRERARACW